MINDGQESPKRWYLPRGLSLEALRNLDTAFAHFFRRCQAQEAGKLRGQGRLSPAQDQEAWAGQLPPHRHASSSFPDAIQLPRLGRLRLKERDYLPTTAKILSATVSEQAGHWYVSVLVEQEHIVPTNSGPVVGVDLGVKTLATLSDGDRESQSTPSALVSEEAQAAAARRLTQAERQPQSHEGGAADSRRLHRRIANQRANTLHQLTSPTGENQVRRGD